MALINPEYRNATITDSYLNWMTGKDNRQHGGIVIEVEFEDKTRRQKLYNLTEGAAPYTTKALRDIGWMGKTYKDFLKHLWLLPSPSSLFAVFNRELTPFKGL